MNVIVFGATGSVGGHVVDQCLEKNYQVTAFSRNAKKISNKFPSSKAVNGDVINLQDVKQAMQGHTAVIIVLGSGSQRTGTVRSVGTRNILEAMKELGITRVVCQTTLGCGESKGNLNFFWKKIMFGWFLKEVFLDHEVQEEYITASNLDWTIIRPASFTDGPKTGNYKHGFSANDRSLALKISRADVADFIVKEVETGRYRREKAGVSY